jgi:hypothetical protein
MLFSYSKLTFLLFTFILGSYPLVSSDKHGTQTRATLLIEQHMLRHAITGESNMESVIFT